MSDDGEGMASMGPECPGCGMEIDPDCCHCGDSREGHCNDGGHIFVPMGCVCGYALSQSARVGEAGE